MLIILWVGIMGRALNGEDLSLLSMAEWFDACVCRQLASWLGGRMVLNSLTHMSLS